MFSLKLTRDHDGRRLDRTLRSIWPGVPLSAIMRALRKGAVRLDSVRVREPGARVGAGQELTVPWEAPGERVKIRRYGQIPVIWRGEGAIIVNKPANLLVQPDVKDGDSVVARVWSMTAENSPDGEGPDDASIPRPAAVHRLDRNTTGALVVALRGDALRALEELFKARRVRKRYLAIVEGRAPDSIDIDAPLLKDPEANTVRVAKPSEEGARSAMTRVFRVAGDDGPAVEGALSLVSVELVTGRTHQARVHLSHVGCPILGDRKYGDFAVNRRWRNVRRPLLHAFELKFPESVPPALKELAGRTFRAPVPQDMREIIDGRGWSRQPGLTEAGI